MTLPKRVLFAAACIALGLLLGLFLMSRLRPAGASATSTASSGPVATAADDVGATELYAHNIMLRKGKQFRVYIRWIRGQMKRTHRDVTPSLDDSDSFVLEIQKGVIRANIGDICNYLNASLPSDAPLKNISIAPFGSQVKLHGTAHKIISLPVELVGELSPSSNDQVRFHVVKINVLKVPLKAILGGLHLELSDLVHASSVPGVQVVDNDIIFDTQKLLPPPHIHGQITTVTVSVPDIEVIYGNAGHDEDRLAQWHNFLKLTGGTLDFGKLTMNHVDLTMIDASQDPWFDLDLVNYQAQLQNGYTRMTPQAGLEIFMPNVGQQAPKPETVSLEWLKDRKRSLPAGIPTK